MLYLAGGVIGSLTFVVGQALQSQVHSEHLYTRKPKQDACQGIPCNILGGPWAEHVTSIPEFCNAKNQCSKGVGPKHSYLHQTAARLLSYLNS